MSIFSRRKRLLNRTSARANSGLTAHGRDRIRKALRRNRAGFTVVGQASGRARFRKIFRRNRKGVPAMPKMSSRRQFHRALRRHPAWPLVMAEAAARAEAHKKEATARAQAQKDVNRDPLWSQMTGQAFSRIRFRRVLRRNRTDVMAMKQASTRTQFRGALRRNRAGLIALISVLGGVALMTGISMAQGVWFPIIATPTDPQPPPARFGAATVYDEANGELLLFGGFSGSTPKDPTNNSVGYILGLSNPSNAYSPPSPLGDTRGLKNGNWVNRSQSAIHAPSPRGYASMAYDGARRNVVLFGGAPYLSNSSNVSGETWTWDGVDWTLRNPPGPRPEPRQNAVMVYDAHRKVVVMFGGRGWTPGPPSLPILFDDTWTWDGSAWKIMPRAGAPSPRHSAAMVYDVCRAEAVMFGGIGLPPQGSSFPPQPGETWTWDGAKWTGPEVPIPSPPRRIGASMAYSHQSGRVLLFGGLDTNDAGIATVAVDSDVWRWDGMGWERMNSEITTASYIPCGLIIACNLGAFGGQPPSRGYASFTNVGGGLFHLYGGTPSEGLAAFSTPAPRVALADQFTFGEKAWFGTDTVSPPSCNNPVPIPPGEAATGQIDPGTEAPKVEAREGVREIGRFPVLLGTDWPQANRVPKVGNTPNPNYTPPPDCPNRPNDENGRNTHLFTDPKRNRVYQFFVCDPERPATTPNRSPKLLIGAYDGTTLKLLGSVLLSVDATYRGLQTFTDDLLLHDAGRGRFILASQGPDNRELVVIRQDLIEKGLDPVVKKITLAGKAVKISFFDHPKTGRAKLLINRVTSLSQLDLEKSILLQTNSVDWNATPCALMGNDAFTFNSTPMRSGNSVYSVCSISGSGQSVRWGVVRMPITENADGTEAAGTAEPPFPGPYSVERDWVDPQAERMLLLSVTSGGSTLYAFDGKASRYVGRSGISTVPPGSFEWYGEFGFDQETGRLYVHMSDNQGLNQGAKFNEPGGLLVLDTRLTPVPQANNFTQFSSIPGASIAALPPEPGLPRRVFMRRREGSVPKYPDGETVKFPNEMFYTVLADEIPVPEKPDLAQLDALTIPIPESPGKTEASFDAEASAYGIRLRSIGGIWSAGRPPQQFYEGAGWELVENALLAQSSFIPTCAFPDRELVAGWVPQARLSDLDAAARSSGLEVDSNSKTDLEGPFTRCNPSLDPSQLPGTGKPVYDLLWPLKNMALFQANAAVGSNLAWGRHFKEVECVGDSTQTNEAKLGDLTVNPAPLVPTGVAVPSGVPTGTVTAPTGGRAPIGGVTSSVTCNQKTGSVQATSRGALGGSASSEAFSVGEGYSTVTVARDPVKGVVVTSTAVATGIKLPGVTIGHVTTTAVAWSNGRPGEGRASFTRTICRVYPPPNNHPEACLDKEGQKKMAKDFNDRMGVNGKMTLPAFDPDLYKGSPGGYTAGVIKPLADETEDQLFAKDFQREVAGLVIEFYKDTKRQGPARQVLQLAAVKAVTGFGVQCNADLVYSSSAKNCVALAFEDDPVEFEEEEEEIVSSDDDGAFNSYDEGGGWVPVATGAPGGLALGKRIGRFIENLPVIRLLPIRQMGEALLAASVWLLLGLPLLLASQRFAMNRARGVE